MKKCLICNKIFKGMGLGKHIRNKHNISPKEYYDIYLLEEGEGICPECGNNTRFKSLSRGYFKYCSNLCSNNSKETRDKVKNTCLEKYGVENPFQSTEIKEKSKRTSLEKYGVEFPSKSELIKQKQKDTCLEKYGVENVFQRDSRFKIEITNKLWEKFKVTNVFQLTEVKEKSVKTMMEKYNVKNASQSEVVKQKKMESSLEKYNIKNPSQSEVVKQKRTQTFIEKYNVPGMWSLVSSVSKPQLELFEICQSIFPYPILEYPEGNYSIDITIPSLSIAIEYDGEYWHKDHLNDMKRQCELEKNGWSFLRYRNYIPNKIQLLEDVNTLLENLWN